MHTTCHLVCFHNIRKTHWGISLQCTISLFTKFTFYSPDVQVRRKKTLKHGKGENIKKQKKKQKTEIWYGQNGKTWTEISILPSCQRHQQKLSWCLVLSSFCSFFPCAVFWMSFSSHRDHAKTRKGTSLKTWLILLTGHLWFSGSGTKSFFSFST